MAFSSKSAAADKILRVGLVYPIDFRHPWKRIDFVNILVYWQVFETVFSRRNRRGGVTQELFTELLNKMPGRDGRNVYSAAIRPGVRFSDGTKMTVDHVVRSLAQNRHLADLTDIKADGDRVCFETVFAESNLALRLTNLELSVVLNKGEDFIGTGAYMRAPDSTPSFTRLVRNPYHRKAVDIDEIHFRTYPRDQQGQAAALIDAVNRGEVDFANCLSRSEMGLVRSACKIFEQGWSTSLFYFNTERKPFDSAPVRRAFCHALDRNELAKLFYSNHVAYVASGIVPPAMDVIADNFEYSLDKARKLINQSKIDPSAKELTLSTICGPRPYLPDPVGAAELIAKQVAPLGFRIKVVPTRDLEDYFNKTSSGDYDLMLSGWIPDTPNAFDFLDVLLSSKNIPGNEKTVMSSINLSRWKNDEMDRALDAYRLDASSARTTIASMLHREAPVIALMYGADILVHSPKVQNVSKGFSELPLFSDLMLAV